MKRPQGFEDEDDLLSCVPASEPTNLGEMMEPDHGMLGSASSVARHLSVNTMGCNLRLTPEGIRKILNRVCRPKPLLRLVCRGCKRSTHDEDTYVPGDYLESLGCGVNGVQFWIRWTHIIYHTYSQQSTVNSR